MAPPEIVPFADEHMDDAVRLLAERHSRHRELEALLPADTDLREQVERERGELAGMVAVEAGEVVGYLLGTRREDQIGPHVWSYIAGHAVRNPELVRDLYAAAAEAWVDVGLTRHFVYRRPPDLRVPVDSIDLADASTSPVERGSGVGLALTHHVLGWAHERGYATTTIDWRMTNLLASRFWPRRGFRETFLRLYRSIP